MNKFLFFFILLLGFSGFAQKDSLKLKNNDIIVGEIKSLTNGVITMKTSYSDKDFKIEYIEVKEIFLNQTFLIYLVGGSHYLGKVRSVKPEIILLESEGVITFETKIQNLISLKPIDTKFWSRFTANIDLGFNVTKANNFNQLTLGSGLEYSGEKWNFDAGYSTLLSNQDNVDEIKRVEWNIETKRLIRKERYALLELSFLSNTEQALKGRVITRGGFGKFFINSNRLYLGVNIGINYNIETYYDESLDKNSTEVFIAPEFNMFEFGDFRLKTGFTSFLSLSESKRFRLDYSLDLKYDLPLDFYIKFDFSLNYDNQPAIEGNDIDYIFNSGFGWELD